MQEPIYQKFILYKENVTQIITPKEIKVYLSFNKIKKK